jgi:hypothetical protein
VLTFVNNTRIVTIDAIQQWDMELYCFIMETDELSGLVDAAGRDVAALTQPEDELLIIRHPLTETGRGHFRSLKECLDLREDLLGE